MIAMPQGEDIILPRSVSLQKAVSSGEFVSMYNVFPFNQTLRNRFLAGGMIASPTAAGQNIVLLMCSVAYFSSFLLNSASPIAVAAAITAREHRHIFTGSVTGSSETQICWPLGSRFSIHW